jgi:hypothetical protein
MSAPKFAVIFKSDMFATLEDALRVGQHLIEQEQVTELYLAEITSLKLFKIRTEIELEEV